MNKLLLRRIGITVLCLVGTIVLAYIPLPFIELEGFQGMGIMRSTVGSLGIMPYVSAYIFLWVLTMIIPSWKKRWQTEEGGKVFSHYVLMLLTLLFSLLQANQLSKWLIQSDCLESGFISIIAIIILVAGVFVFIGFANIINRKGIGQGFSLIICFGFLRKIIQTLLLENKYNEVLKSVGITAVLLVILTGFIIWVTKIKWTFGSGNKKMDVPFSIVGLFPSQVFGLVMIIIIILQLINPKLVNVFVTNFYMWYIYLPISLIVCLIVSFFYLRRIIIKLTESNEIVSSKIIWKKVILWTLAFFIITQSHSLLLLIVKKEQFFYLVVAPVHLYIFIFTITTFVHQWRCRNWKTVFSHSDPANVYAKAAELQQENKEVRVVPTEGLGAAYGLLVGHLSERLVLTKNKSLLSNSK